MLTLLLSVTSDERLQTTAQLLKNNSTTHETFITLSNTCFYASRLFTISKGSPMFFKNTSAVENIKTMSKTMQIQSK